MVKREARIHILQEYPFAVKIIPTPALIHNAVRCHLGMGTQALLEQSGACAMLSSDVNCLQSGIVERMWASIAGRKQGWGPGELAEHGTSGLQQQTEDAVIG